jgi:acyl carrier protein
MKRDDIAKIVFAGFEQVLIDKDHRDLIEINEKTELMGLNSIFDSVDLVTFIVSLEQTMEDEYSTSVTIADENAMSQTESPFKNLGTLIDFIQKQFK